MGEATEPEGPGSVAGKRAVAAQVLDALIDARLLTSYEVPAEREDDPPHQRIEIIHESLLSNWPRLVRWQTQDADSAQLRDQVRQAAQMWIERGKPQDLLWTGTSFEEYRLWRERYEGGLSTTEEAFGEAMTDRAERQKRRRRLVIAAAFTLLLAILAVVGVSRQQAVAAARRAEAQKLLALGQVELETWPTVALAYATASLELADSPQARLFAMRALAAGPPATVLDLGFESELDRAHSVVFSPDGAWAALRGYHSLQVVSRDGRTHRSLRFSSDADGVAVAFDPRGEKLFGAKSGELRVWSIPDFETIEEKALPEGNPWLLRATPRGLFALTQQGEEMVITAHSLGGEPQLIGRIEAGRWEIDIDAAGRWLAFAAGSDLFLRSLEDWSRPERRIGSQESEIEAVVFHPAGDRVATKAPGEVRTWSTGGEITQPLGAWPTSLWVPAFDPRDRFFAVWGEDANKLWVDLWDHEAPADASAWRVGVSLPGLGSRGLHGATVEPGGPWLATAQINVVGFWPLNRRLSRILSTDEFPVDALAFTPDGASLVSARRDGELRLWGLGAGMKSRVLARASSEFSKLDIDRGGQWVASARQGGALLVPLDGGAPRELEGFASSAWVVGVAIDETGRLVAASPIRGPRSEKVIRIWDLETEDSWTLGPTEEAGEGFDGQIINLAFRPDGSLVSVGDGGLRVWSPRDKTYELLAPTMGQSQLALFGGGRYAAYFGGSLDNPDHVALSICDFENGSVRTVPSHGPAYPLAVDPSDTLLVSGGTDGIVRVGPLTGGEPHLLIGHEQFVNAVAVSPDGQWIASSSDDSTIRLWPMPDITRTPFHLLPYAELLAKLRSLTNVRVVPDEDSGSGWRVDVGPFPGWEKVPTW